MTLLETIPSLQPAIPPRLSPAIWPHGTEYDSEGRITVGGVALTGLSIDVCSGGELAVALSAGVDPRRLILHGSGRSCAELAAAVRCGAGRIVLDSLTDIALLTAPAQRPQPVLLRLSPGIQAVSTSSHRDSSSAVTMSFTPRDAGRTVRRGSPA
ncbi:hypothetical protein AB0H60_19255 [Nocardia rhamnosiphila]|uniref:hypothetical protein n=1 Tax=Nocardia rhamnosiphila TaxID=426716 RepID=UPI0033E0C9C9